MAATVVDDATGKPLSCTVAMQRADGHLEIENRSFLDGFRCDGSFQKTVPAGMTRVTVTRGFDYRGEQREITLQPGDVQRMEFRLSRQTPLLSLGWVCGDSHVHMTHGESHIVVDFPYVALAARAEALDYLSIAQRWNMPDATAASVDQVCRRVSTPETLIAWNMEAPKNYYRGDASHCLGHGWFIGARTRTQGGKDPVAELAAMNAMDLESDKAPTPNFETHALVHDLGGTCSYTHPCRWWWGKWGGQGIYPPEVNKFVSNLAQELPFDTVVGPTYDSIDIMMQTREKEVNADAQKLWFKLLNRGYRLGATASTDATFDNEGSAVPGRVRTYTHVDGKPSLASIAASMRAGRNFVTSGPLMLFTVDGQAPGSILQSDTPVHRTAKVRAWASGKPGEYLTRIEFVVNGGVVRSVEVPGRATYFETEHAWMDEEGGWAIARCLGSDADNQVAVANPVYLERGRQRSPEPALARVKLTVRDSRTSAPLSGRCSVVQMVGRNAQVLQTEIVTDGSLVVAVPGTSRLRIEAPGYAPVMKSIFLDYAPVLNSTLNTRVEQLLDWSTFEHIRLMLNDVTLEFDMERA